MVFALLIALFVIAVIGYLKRIALNAQLQKVREAAQTEIARLRELASAQRYVIEVEQKNTEQWRSHAKEALKLAHEKHFPAEVPRDETAADVENRIRSMERSQSNYTPPSIAGCPQCGVSVRSEMWPQQCSACRTLFNADGSLDVLEAGSLE